ncbi:MAG: hypothetical protein EBZ62_05515, partial [Sphingobacteriia bacterium]|nr:hypothetical protein [Sphingobacteriia bacterium]
AQPTPRLAQPTPRLAQPILRPALHPVLQPAPLQVRAVLLPVLLRVLRVPVVPVRFLQGVKATISYAIEFSATDLLGWVNIIIWYRA